LIWMKKRIWKKGLEWQIAMRLRQRWGGACFDERKKRSR